MNAFAARFAALVPDTGYFSLIDLTRLRPLMAQDAGLRFLTSLLSPAEARLFADFTYPKRRLEWLGGRLAAKHCLGRLAASEQTAQLFYRDYPLLPDAHGCPLLAEPHDLKDVPAISLSHSRDYAAALVTVNGACGLDIQQKTAQLIKVQERFATEEEQALLQQVTSPLTRLGIIWTAKEAVKKCLLSDQSTFFGAISLTEIIFNPKEALWIAHCQVKGGTDVTIRITEFGDYLIACTMKKRYA